MPIKTMDSSLVRKHWRDALDTAATGRADLVITRYGRPVAAMICYADYARLRAAQQESYQTMVAPEAHVATEWNCAEEDVAWQDL